MKTRTQSTCFATGPARAIGDTGFTLIEVVIALVVIMVALLGVVASLTYAITYNAGNKSRAQTLAVMQQEVERYRAAKFNSATTDAYTSPASPGLCRTDGLRDLTGRSASTCRVNSVDNMSFDVTSAVDNDPFTNGIQGETHVCTSPQGAAVTCALKEITIQVVLAAPSPGWQTAVPARTVLRRVQGN